MSTPDQSPGSSVPTTHPTQPEQRSELIDSLRGFALFGVCLSNLYAFSGYEFMTNQRTELILADLSAFFDFVFIFLVNGKFLTLFTMLFGLGFGMFFLRIEKKNAHALTPFIRRLILLLLTGLIHLIFWPGDILHYYALLGFPLLLFRKVENRRLLPMGLTMSTLLPTLLLLGVTLSSYLDGSIQDVLKSYEKNFRIFYAGFSSPDFVEVFKTNVKMYIWMNRTQIHLITFFGGFLTGLWAGRSGLVDDLQNNRTTLIKIRKISGWIGFPIMGGITGIFILNHFIPQDGHVLLMTSDFFPMAMMPLAIFYALTFMLLWQKDSWKKRLAHFAPFGRMALTNYLMQTALHLFLFYKIGLGLMGSIGPAFFLPWAMLVCALQIWLSHLWLNRYRFGPAEWVWRSFTYKKWQPLKKKA